VAEWKRVLGVDPGTIITGYGVVDFAGSQMRHVASGIVKPARGRSMPERLTDIHRGLATIIEEHQPQVLCVEEAFFGTNPKTAIKLGQARGAILILGVLNELEIAEYSPRFVKQAVVGTGGATKEQVSFMVTRILSLKKPPQPADVTDALAVALCHILRPRIDVPDGQRLTRAQRQLKALGAL
jgi:crossover junction endodeoxyribonuclease RuvC